MQGGDENVREDEVVNWIQKRQLDRDEQDWKGVAKKKRPIDANYATLDPIVHMLARRRKQSLVNALIPSFAGFLNVSD